MTHIVGTTTKEELGVYRNIRTDEHGNLCVSPPASGLPYNAFLTISGDNVGTWNQNVDYSSTPTDIYHLAVADIDIYTFLINITDNAKFAYDAYGAIAGGLTNGVSFGVIFAGTVVEVPLVSGIIIKQNHQWLNISQNVMLTSFDGLPQSISISLPISAQHGIPLRLKAGDKFIAHLHDNFSTLISQTFQLKFIRHTG